MATKKKPQAIIDRAWDYLCRKHPSKFTFASVDVALAYAAGFRAANRAAGTTAKRKSRK